MSIVENVKDLQQQARNLERATLVQICHLVRKAVPEAKTFLVALEVHGHEQLQASIEVGAYTKAAAYEWDDELTTEEVEALRDLELLLAGCPKFNVAGDKTITITKLIGDEGIVEGTGAGEVEQDREEARPEPEPEPISVNADGEWRVLLNTADFHGSLTARPLEDGEFFVEIVARSYAADATLIEGSADPGQKVRLKVTSSLTGPGVAERSRVYVQSLLEKAGTVTELNQTIESFTGIVVA